MIKQIKWSLAVRFIQYRRCGCSKQFWQIDIKALKFPKNYAFQLQNNFVTSQKSLLNVSFVQKNEIMVSFKFQHAFENECNLNGNFVLYFTHRFFLSENFFIFSRFFVVGHSFSWQIANIYAIQIQFWIYA